MWKIISRRDCIKKIFVGSASLCLIPSLPVLDNSAKKTLVSLERLREAVNPVKDIYIYRSPDCKDYPNLDYAFEKISPSNHFETAIVVAFSLADATDTSVFVDEFVRRRAGLPGKLPDYGPICLKRRCVPECYGMPLFNETIVALFMEIFAYDRVKAEQLLRFILEGKGLFINFPSLVGPAYEKLPDDEIDTIIDAIDTYRTFCGIRSYTVCSTIASRAE